MADNYSTQASASDSLATAEPEEKKDQASSGKSNDDILAEARSRLTLAEEAESEIREAALDDLKFLSGEQWPTQIKADRESDGRPCLVINRLPQFVQQVTNDQRQNRPSIKVHPVGDGAGAETGKVIQGLIRHIEYNSNADAAYDTGFESAVGGSFGYWRIVPDFVSPESFDQELFIRRIRNPFSVFLDPYSQEPDGSDASWAFVVEDLSADEYRARFPDSELASKTSGDWDALGNSQPRWIKSDSARVAEYFYKEYRDTKVHLLSTGVSVREDELQDHLAKAQAAGVSVSVAKSRKTQVPVIKWCKLNGVEILEQTELPKRCRFIPIVPVYGAERFVDGKRILESVTRNAKDPQRMYNYWKSAETEAIALAPRAPFIGAEGQFEGREEQWKTANKRNHAYLEYKPTTIAGQQAPPPQRQAFEPAVQAISQAAMFAADDLKATTGIYDASLGAQSQEQSGIAIQRRNVQSQTSNFHFVDNLTRSLRHTGRILIDWIPSIYDTPRAARIIGEDGEQKMVRLNEPHVPSDSKDGKEVLYSLEAGRYDVTVDSGPSFESKRQEAAASMMDLSKSVPQVMQVAADLIVKNMDWPGAQEIAERIKKSMPPNLIDDPKAQQIPPQVQAQMQQMGQMIDSLTKNLHDASQVIETKRMDLESRERIEMAKLQTEAEIAMAKLGSQESMALLKHQIAEIESRMELLNFAQPIETGLEPSPSAPSEPADAPPEMMGGAEQGQEEAQTPTGGPSPGTPLE